MCICFLCTFLEFIRILSFPSRVFSMRYPNIFLLLYSREYGISDAANVTSFLVVHLLLESDRETYSDESWELSGRCLPCREGCQFCRDDTPCLAQEDTALRLAMVSIQGFCMLLDIISMVVVYHFRRNKVNTFTACYLICKVFVLYFDFILRDTWAKEKLELDFSLGRFIGLKGKYCFSKCHSLFVLSYYFSQPYFSEDQSIWSYTYWSDTFRICTSLLPCKYQEFISAPLSKWKRNINFPFHPMSLFMINMKRVNTILLQ